MAAAVAVAAEATALPTPYHRSDPLDIPLIDGHLLTHFLLPRLVGAIKLAFPQVYLDWTTGTIGSDAVVAAENGHPGAPRDSRDDYSAAAASSSRNNNTLVWKRAVEALLRACLLLASCRHVLRRRDGGTLTEKDIRIATPAMQNLGMTLRPAAGARPRRSAEARHQSRGGSIVRALGSRLQVYGKLAALILATVILPSLYRELEHRRERELEVRDRRGRLEEIRRELSGAAPFVGAQQRRREQQQRRSPSPSSRGAPAGAATVRRRGQQRRSLLRVLLADAVLGMGDVLLPPLRLIQYLSYLWGVGAGANTPSLGMALVGWEYAPAAPAVGDGSGGGPPHERYQRHANFQYGHRRLLVEEALQTVAAVLPPRRGAGNIGGDGGGSGNGAVAAPGVAADRRPDQRSSGLTAGGGNSTDRAQGDGGERGSRGNGAPPRISRIRQWFLSVVGAAEEDSAPPAPPGDGSGRSHTPLPCSLCRAASPTVPYVASCGHCYCYLCLRTAVTDDLRFRCVECGKVIVSSRRGPQ